MTKTSFTVGLATHQHLESDNTDKNSHKVWIEGMFNLRDGLQDKR